LKTRGLYPARGSGESHQTTETKQEPGHRWNSWGGYTSGRNKIGKRDTQKSAKKLGNRAKYLRNGHAQS